MRSKFSHFGVTEGVVAGLSLPKFILLRVVSINGICRSAQQQANKENTNGRGGFHVIFQCIEQKQSNWFGQWLDRIRCESN